MIRSTLSLYQALIDTELAHFFDKKIESAKTVFLKENYGHLREFVSRPGKRIRPMLSIMSFKAIRGGDETKMYPASIASELFHASSLIHDDIMDEDTIRRNKPTMHIIFERSLGKDKLYDGQIFNSINKRYGTSMAIMQGNLLFALAFECILESTLPLDIKSKSLLIFNEAYKKTNEGQMMDVRLPFIKKPSMEDYHQMIQGKTVHPIIASVMFGALANGAKREQLRVLHEYAYHLGLAFQMHDDVLDFNPGKGRSIGSDVRTGVKTIVAVHAINHANALQKKLIESTLGNAKASEKKIKSVIEAFEAIGSIKYAQAQAGEHVRKAKQVITQSDLSKESKLFFVDLAQYVIERKE